MTPGKKHYDDFIMRDLQRKIAHHQRLQIIPRILEAISYDREAGRKMLLRMHQAGELVSPARGLYTTAHHPCLLHFTNDSSPAPTVPIVSNVSSVASPSSALAPSPQSEASPAPAVPVPDPTTSMLSPVSHVPIVANVSSLSPPPAHSPQNNSSSISNVPIVPIVSNPPHRENGIGIGGDKEEL